MPAHKRLTPTDWANVITLYQRGEKNLRELAEQFGVSQQAIQQGLKARGIEKGSRLEEVIGEAKDEARERREARVAQANATVDNYAKWIDVIAKLTMKRVIDGDRSGALATENANILVLKNAMAVIQKARNESWDILDIKDLLGENAELPDLNVGEYTEDEIQAIRDGNEERYNESLHDEDSEEELDEAGD